jgi:hypothetical protein
MDSRPAPVVRLEGPLALGHGCISSSYGGRYPVYTLACVHRRSRQPLVSSGLARNRRGPETRSQPYRQRMGDCSRVLTSLPLVKPPCHAVHHRRIPSHSRTTRHSCHSRHGQPARRYTNVTGMLQNGWHSPRKLLTSAKAASARGRHANQPAGAQAGGSPVRHRIARINCQPEFLRRYAARRGRLSCPHLWITMWTDSSSSRFR